MFTPPVRGVKKYIKCALQWLISFIYISQVGVWNLQLTTHLWRNVERNFRPNLPLGWKQQKLTGILNEKAALCGEIPLEPNLLPKQLGSKKQSR